ncbi:MAG: ATPase domain-containing protein, partial [Chitinophagaceae bacterium]
MSKAKKSYFCQNCGYESVKWAGQCPSCSQWNCFVEEILQKENYKNKEGWNDYNEKKRNNKIISLQEIKSNEEERLSTPDIELNRVLGGGIVPGSLVLISGEPGIGKSTLFLQIGLLLNGVAVLYISGEESEQQIKMRADRLKMMNDHFFLLTETSTQTIFQEIKKLKPQLVVVDSI